MKKPFKVCSCGCPLYPHEVTWLRKVQIWGTVVLKFFNCPKCNSTGAVKHIRKVA